ncbi:Hsp20/alpha crystallin family protein [Cuneatibacter caecimuris]|uniref:HSP20 family molecular chaperone IbpA n=1 Tax=Cuneatibacter caecimuris TaxID=1796618 RepID=A0A4Q7P3J6_9FIRM|nr:Hsp20/alpha crystallin family protein [Cuneatibacter caecimuris]RZS94395.1 HSP20 family molecular chaperone IbpA [Cuneatibacter caecimuris]
MLMPRTTFDLIDEMFEPFFATQEKRPVAMKTDILEKDGNYIMEIDLPGYKKDEIKAELKKGYLTITAEKTAEDNDMDKNGSYIRRERYSGKCQRSYFVGEALRQEDMKARFENGILTLVFPKEAPKQVEENRFISIEG